MSWVTCTIVAGLPSRLAVDAQQDVLELGASQRVHRRERLVEEDDLRVRDQRTGDGDALLHPAGELPRILVRSAFEAHLPQDCLCSLDLPALRQPEAAEREHHVPNDRQPGEERAAVVLEDEGHLPGRAHDGAAVEEHGAVGGSASGRRSAAGGSSSRTRTGRRWRAARRRRRRSSRSRAQRAPTPRSACRAPRPAARAARSATRRPRGDDVSGPAHRLPRSATPEGGARRGERAH